MAETDVLQAAGVEGRTHHFPADRVHFTWDVAHEPVLTVASGATVVMQTRDVSDNQISPESTAADLDLDWDRVYPLAGPIAVEGAEPGHTLAIEILDLHTLGWGWTAMLPGLGCFRTTSRIRT
jgi:acetamidase/formamidase